MKFKCRCCGEYVDEKAELIDGFIEIAYNSFEWLDRNEEIPVLDNEVWNRSQELPNVDEYRYLKVLPPFYEETGDEFNVLYMPAMSYLNGWSEYPDEIAKSAIIRCKFEQIMEADEFTAWIKVLILKVTKLKDLCGVYPAGDNKLINRRELFGDDAIDFQFNYQNWRYSEWSVQGDFGQWHLIYTDSTGLSHLVLLGEWDFHADFVQCGNLIITD